VCIIYFKKHIHNESQGKEVELLLDFMKNAEIEYRKQILEIHKIEARSILESALFKVNMECLFTEEEAANATKNKDGIIDSLLKLIRKVINSVLDAFKNIFGITESMNDQEYLGQYANKQIKFDKDPNKVSTWFMEKINKGHAMVHNLINGKPVNDNEFNQFAANPDDQINKFLGVTAGSLITTGAGLTIAKTINGDFGKKSKEATELDEEVKKYREAHKAEMNENIGDKVEKGLSAIGKYVSKFGELGKTIGGKVATACNKIKDKKSGKITDPKILAQNFGNELDDKTRQAVSNFIESNYTKYSTWDSTSETDLINAVKPDDSVKRTVIGYAKALYTDKVNTNKK
jgi:hypothetical protein